MAQVCLTPAATHLSPPHQGAGIFGCVNPLGRKRRPETGPAGPRVELGLGAEQFIAAANALVDPILFAVVVYTRKRPFSSLLSADIKLLRRKLRLPLLIGLRELVVHS